MCYQETRDIQMKFDSGVELRMKKKEKAIYSINKIKIVNKKY